MPRSNEALAKFTALKEAYYAIMYIVDLTTTDGELNVLLACAAMVAAQAGLNSKDDPACFENCDKPDFGFTMDRGGV